MSEVFTVDHFKAYAQSMVLDSGEFWEPESFQLEVVEDLFAGSKEVWLICPEGSGKSTFLSGLALYHMDFTSEAMVPVAAASRDQTEILYRQAAGFIRRSPGFESKADRFYGYDGYREIRHFGNGSRLKVYAADDKTGDGVIPTLALLDELHRHKSLSLYRTWQGKLWKRSGQLITISTAGEIGSEFEDVRLKHRTTAEHITVNGAHTRAEGNELVLHDWFVADEADVTDMAVVKAANPLSTVTEETLARKFASPTMQLAHWKRFVANQAARREGEGITPTEWDRLARNGLELANPLAGSSFSVGGIDLGWKIDTSAFAIVRYDDEEHRVVVASRVIPAPVTQEEIVTTLVELQRDFEPVGWAYDPNAGAQQMVELLESGEHPQQQGVGFKFFKFTQGAPMGRAAGYLAEAVRNEWLLHDGDPTLREHVLNSVAVETKYGDFRYERPKHATGEQRAKYPIDALSALLMAHAVAVDENKAPAPVMPMMIVVGH